MASNTRKKKIVKKIQKRNGGKSRKRELRKNGTTPPFPVHPETPVSVTTPVD